MKLLCEICAEELVVLIIKCGNLHIIYFLKLFTSVSLSKNPILLFLFRCCYAKKLLKEGLQLFNNRLLLFSPLTAAKSGDRRHQSSALFGSYNLLDFWGLCDPETVIYQRVQRIELLSTDCVPLCFLPNLRIFCNIHPMCIVS